jgi:hypothetical protein
MILQRKMLRLRKLRTMLTKMRTYRRRELGDPLEVPHVRPDVYRDYAEADWKVDEDDVAE